MKTEKSDNRREKNAGSGKVPSCGRQTATARTGIIRPLHEVTLEEVLNRDNMWQALDRVVTNKGAAGVDGMTVEELGPYLRTEWPRIREELLSGNYRPQPVLKEEIPKPGGAGMRTLGIPTVVDRMIQQAIQQRLQEAIDWAFSDFSKGFRPNCSAHQAVEIARQYVRAGFRWVVDMDLEKFFDRVNHDILMALVARRVKDKRLLRLIRRYLEAGMMSGGIESPREQGTPQGSPLSPLLSNIMLDELDKELERRGHRFVRYADDCNVYVKSRRAGERVFGSIERWLAKRLRLTVNRAKSAVDRPWKRKFLGYTITWHREAKLAVAPESIRRLKDKLREHFRRGRGRNVKRFIGELTPVLRGWLNYFGKSEVKACFEETDQWIRRKVRCILWRQWKRPRTRMKKLMALGLPKERAWKSANNGHGPWWNAGASHMNHAIPLKWFKEGGLYPLMENYSKMQKVP